MTFLNRISGFSVIIFGLVLIFFIFPDQIEFGDYGWVKPQTLPNICAFILLILGLIQTIFPTGKIKFEINNLIFSGVFAITSILGVVGFHYLGFIFAAPLFSLVIMLLIGERRIMWLIIGVVVLPMFIWFLVEYLLERGLP